MKPLPRHLRAQEFLERVEPIPESGCWIWLGGNHANGYGGFNLDGKKDYAHRAAYRLFVGEIPEGKIVCHKCDVKMCVNPAHLYVGTYFDNSMDMVRSRQTGRFLAHSRS